MIKPPCETCSHFAPSAYRGACVTEIRSVLRSPATGEFEWYRCIAENLRLRRLFCHYEPKDGERE